MMWYLQLFVECVAQGLADDAILNLIFAALAMWAGFGKSPRLCAVCTAALHLILVLL